ncbi:MAG: fibronectin type III domain-containing protein [Coriobacteriales bacterium]|jgi:hypothetical protein|nr:fibronectin type III domain-containing protein [Coriobacteriales bacterium]
MNTRGGEQQKQARKISLSRLAVMVVFSLALITTGSSFTAGDSFAAESSPAVAKAATKTKKKSKVINLSKASKTDLRISNQTWTGKKIKPKSFIYKGKKYSISKNATVKSYGANKKIGTGKITLVGKGSFKGKTTITFKIIPKKTSVKKVDSGEVGSKQITVTWKKTAADQKISNYQLRYRIVGDSNAWTTLTYNAATAKATITELKKNKRYQVQVRSYKTVGGVKYYSAWSDRRAVPATLKSTKTWPQLKVTLESKLSAKKPAAGDCAQFVYAMLNDPNGYNIDTAYHYWCPNLWDELEDYRVFQSKVYPKRNIGQAMIDAKPKPGDIVVIACGSWNAKDTEHVFIWGDKEKTTKKKGSPFWWAGNGWQSYHQSLGMKGTWKTLVLPLYNGGPNASKNGDRFRIYRLLREVSSVQIERVKQKGSTASLPATTYRVYKTEADARADRNAVWLYTTQATAEQKSAAEATRTKDLKLGENGLSSQALFLPVGTWYLAEVGADAGNGASGEGSAGNGNGGEGSDATVAQPAPVYLLNMSTPGENISYSSQANTFTLTIRL